MRKRNSREIKYLKKEEWLRLLELLLCVEMDWKYLNSQLSIGGKPIPVRSLKMRGEVGDHHRYRVSTVWDFSNKKFTRVPGQARLVKDKQGRIGVMLTGKGSALVKVGVRNIQQSVLTSFDALSKKAQKQLVKQIDGELFEQDGVMLIRQKSTVMMTEAVERSISVILSYLPLCRYALNEDWRTT